MTKDVVAIIKAADTDQPSAETRKMLADLFNSDPTVWRAAGDMVEQAARMLISKIAPSHAVKASMTRGWEQLPRDLARPSDGELERLLVQQAVMAWLHLGYIEYQYSAMTTETGLTMKRAEYWERRLSAAQRRYLRATETLARVRRLQLPAVQVNIGAQQVNQIT
jgi:hypothetical protein